MAEPGDPAPLSLAQHHLRLLALVLDYIAALLAVKFFLIAVTGNHWDLALADGGQDWTLAQTMGATLGLLALRDVWGGKSLGKRLTGIAVVRARQPGRGPAPWSAVVRGVALALFPVEAVLVFADPYCRRVGDHLAGTVVIQNPHAPSLARRLLLLSSLFLLIGLLALTFPRWYYTRSAAYQTALAALQARPLEPVVGADPDVERFTFDMTPEGDSYRAVVVFELKGDGGEGSAKVEMRLDKLRKQWDVTGLSLEKISKEEKEKKDRDSKRILPAPAEPPR
ncbi:MAG: RDD family protein [Deltaproteobacteria bacterium]|nr:RDD family protein [Deltaproteobacteria bacterium]